MRRALRAPSGPIRADVEFSMRTLPLVFSAAIIAGACSAAGAAPPFTVRTVATGLDNPWAMTFLPDGRALITEKTGKIRLLSAAGKLGGPLAGIPAVAYGGQGGLLDVEIGPGFATDRYVYISYSEPGKGENSNLAVARAKFTGDRFGPFAVIWRNQATTGGQFGGRLAFRPDDTLFVSTGERQQFTPSQATGGTLGKIVRLTWDGKPKPGNPFAGNKAYRPEIWTLGHRNPYGLAFDPATGNLWEHEMGPKGGDELNLIVKGRNYGWPRASNGSNYDGSDIPDHKAGDGFEPPRKFWNPSISPAGMIFYTGDRFPQWKGHILMGALSGEALFSVAISGTAATAETRYDMGERIREVQQGPDGSVYLLTDGDDGKLLRLLPK